MKLLQSVIFLTFILTIMCSCKKSGTTNNTVLPRQDTLSSGWTKINSPFLGQHAYSGGDIFFIDQNIGYACNLDLILKSIDGGNSWNQVSDDKKAPNISMTPDGKVFLGNDNYDSLYRSVDGGVNFIPTYTYGAKPNDIYFKDNSTGLCTTRQAILLNLIKKFKT